MKRITRHLISGMATAGIALSASSLGLPIPTPPMSTTPSLDAEPTLIAPEAVNALLWSPGESVAPGWVREAIAPVATMETLSNTWGTESAVDLISFSILGVTTPGSELTTARGWNAADGSWVRPLAGETQFNPWHGPASLSEPATFTLLALGLACLAIRDSLARTRTRPAASIPVPAEVVHAAPAAHASQGALVCVPPRDSRPFECTPITRSHKNRRRRRA
jgi:hypothetical protein